MRLAVELEFSDERAAEALEWLQSLPAGLVVRFRSKKKRIPTETAPASMTTPGEELSEEEQHRLLHEVFGSWQSDETGEELVRQIYEARQDAPREVNL